VDLPRGQNVTLTLYDARGATVRRLHAGVQAAGSGIITWDGRDHSGRPAASGVYFARLKTDRRELTERVLIVR
jgi:flagellar hook assembly protein FlgD